MKEGPPQWRLAADSKLFEKFLEISTRPTLPYLASTVCTSIPPVATSSVPWNAILLSLQNLLFTFPFFAFVKLSGTVHARPSFRDYHIP
jgi:hypothetical protein